jgi:hypothetical protein
MADQPQQAPASIARSAAPAGAGPPAPKKPLVAKLAARVAAHAYMSLAIIIVLLILVFGLVVYYRGLWFLGPYAAGALRGKKGARGKKKDQGGGEGAPGALGSDEKGDPETERLIDSINRQ